MKLNEFKGAEAVTVLTEIAEPITELIKDEKYREILGMDEIFIGKVMQISAWMLENHYDATMRLLSALSKRDIDELKTEMTVLDITDAIGDFLLDEEVTKVFRCLSQKMGGVGTGSRSAK